MRRSGALAAVILAVGVAGACAAGPAFAASGTPASTHQEQTRVEKFTVPAAHAAHEIHSAFKATGVVQALNGSKWQPAASAVVAYYVRSLPSGKWSYAGRSKANAKGAFSWAPELTRLGRLQWQARILKATVGSTTFKPSVSAAKNSSFVDRTYVTHFVAMHLNGATSPGRSSRTTRSRAGCTMPMCRAPPSSTTCPPGARPGVTSARRRRRAETAAAWQSSRAGRSAGSSRSSSPPRGTSSAQPGRRH